MNSTVDISKIVNFVKKFVKKKDLSIEEDIFATGFINSLFAMQLVMFVEKEFEVRVENEDLNYENFRTIERIAELIERKIGTIRNK